jgi:hypothetical protein
MFTTVFTTARQHIVAWVTLRPAGNHRNLSTAQTQPNVTDALSKLSLCTRPPGSDVRTMATETTRTSGRDTRHKAVSLWGWSPTECFKLLSSTLKHRFDLDSCGARGITDRCEWWVRVVFRLKYIELKCLCVLCALNCIHVNMCTAHFNRLLRDKIRKGKELRRVGQVVRGTSTLYRLKNCKYFAIQSSPLYGKALI